VRAGLHRPNSEQNIRMTGDNNDRQLNAVFASPSLQLQPAHLWHTNIKQQTTWASWIIMIKKILRRLTSQCGQPY